MSFIESAKPKKTRPRADFKDDAFRKLIESQGLRFLWQRCIVCPCIETAQDIYPPQNDFSGGFTQPTRRARTGNHNPDCPLCKGEGRFYEAGNEVKAVVSRSERNPERFRLWGEDAVGMLHLSLLPECIPGTHDRFVALESIQSMQEVRTRGESPIEALKLPIVSRYLNTETGGWRDIEGVRNLIATNAEGKIEPGTESLVLNLDFLISNTGKIDWTPGITRGTAPPKGARYSVKYWANPSYVVVNYPHDQRHARIKTKRKEPETRPLPVQVYVRLDSMEVRP